MGRTTSPKMTEREHTLSMIDHHSIRKWLPLWVVILFAALLVMFAFFPEVGEATETEEKIWRMKIHYGLLDKTVCAHYNFDTLDSCEKTKDWFVAVTEWHGQNTYQCVLDSQCPKE